MSQNKQFFALCLLASASIPTIAHAQTAPVAADAPGAVSSVDIVVTAQRREQRLQDVPLAVSAASAAQLNAAGVTNTEKLATVVPGLIMTQQRTGYSPYLRGVGTQNTAVGDEPAVATYVDGVYMASAASVVFDMNNIERVEVLRGPQGTLFGRNATGGLINVITRTPSHDSSVEGAISYGNYNTVAGRVYATTGLSDNLAVDLALTGKYQGDGFGRNVTQNKDAFFHRSWGARSKLFWEPSDTVTITLTGDYTRKTSDFGADRGIYPGAITSPGTVNNVVVEPGSSYVCFRCSYDKLTKDPVTVGYGLALITKIDLNSTVSLTSTTAWRYSLSNYAADTDAGAPRVSDIYLREHTDTVQQEFLVNGDLGHLAYTAGLFLFYSDGMHDPLSLRSQFNPVANLDRIVRLKTSSYAPFAQLTYDFGQGTSITGGLRYTSDKREYDGVNYVSSFAAGANLGPLTTVAGLRQDESSTYRKVTWRGAIDHKFSRDFMIYGSISRGFKSGAYNSTTVGTPPVRPETLDAYEVGFKSTLFDRQLTFNVSAFHYDYKDIQLFSVVGATAFLLNAAKGKIDGVDVEAVFNPHLDHGNLSASARASFLPKATYESFPNAQFYYPQPALPCGPTTSPNPSQTTGAPTGGNLQCVGDASGHRMIKAPKLTATFAVDYSVPVGDNRIAFNGTLSHNSGFFFDPDSRLKQDSFQLVNGSIAFYLKDDKIGVRLFGANIFNKQWISSVQTSGFSDSTFMADPGTYGVALEFKL